MHYSRTRAASGAGMADMRVLRHVSTLTVSQNVVNVMKKSMFGVNAYHTKYG